MEEQQESSSQTQLLHYWGNTPEEEYYSQQGIKSTHSYYTSPRGLSLFTKSWLPMINSSHHPPRGIIYMVHGYGNGISWTFQATAIFLAQMGFACFAVDIEGHGNSQGLKGYVPNVDLVVEDCLSFFNSIKQETQFHGLPCFLYGESMGGAICLLIHLADPLGFAGAVLVAPMCRVSDYQKPRWPLYLALIILAKFFPTLAILPLPAEDFDKKCIKVEAKRIIGSLNPLKYRGNPRIGTAAELLRVTDYLSRRLCDVSLPFIVVHGSVDVVTDPNASKALYEEAKSVDKTIRFYDGMMHSLLFGETDENVEIVRNDILCWLNDRSRQYKQEYCVESKHVSERRNSVLHDQNSIDGAQTS